MLSPIGLFFLFFILESKASFIGAVDSRESKATLMRARGRSFSVRLSHAAQVSYSSKAVRGWRAAA